MFLIQIGTQSHDGFPGKAGKLSVWKLTQNTFLLISYDIGQQMGQTIQDNSSKAVKVMRDLAHPGPVLIAKPRKDISSLGNTEGRN